MASTALGISTKAVRMMTLASGSTARISASDSMPPMRGMARSRSTTEGRSRPYASAASAPSSTLTTRHPSAPKMSARRERISGSSSTTSRVVVPRASAMVREYRGGEGGATPSPPGRASGLLLDGAEDTIGLERHLPDPRPRGGKEGVGQRGRDGGRAGRAPAGGILGALDDV